MTKLELIERLSRNAEHLKIKDIKAAVYTTFETVCTALEDGNRVEIRGFGSFSLHRRDARTARNPKTGKTVQVEAKSIPHFRAGKAMRQRIGESFSNLDKN